MQFYKKSEKKNSVVTISKLKRNRTKYQTMLWIFKISVLAFSLSLILSLFSEMLLNKSNLLLAIFLLVIFMLLNVFADMLGLAITSCQIEELKRANLNQFLYKKCLKLIKNSDKVSSILCDVIGDISGILCGVSGTMIALIISSNYKIISLSIFFGALVSSLIAGLTVLFKAIAKNYAVNNSLKIVKRSARFIILFKSFPKKILNKNDKRAVKK